MFAVSIEKAKQKKSINQSQSTSNLNILLLLSPAFHFPLKHTFFFNIHVFAD